MAFCSGAIFLGNAGRYEAIVMSTPADSAVVSSVQRNLSGPLHLARTTTVPGYAGVLSSRLSGWRKPTEPGPQNNGGMNQKQYQAAAWPGLCTAMGLSLEDQVLHGPARSTTSKLDTLCSLVQAEH